MSTSSSSSSSSSEEESNMFLFSSSKKNLQINNAVEEINDSPQTIDLSKVVVEVRDGKLNHFIPPYLDKKAYKSLTEEQRLGKDFFADSK